MKKIMLVEDDNNLREIYEARLAAEGYTIVSAEDGEAALALAAKERPDLVITDVMMPKISGFEMLDILRNTENLRDIKVIMLTALGQAEDNARANTLGADRYLVKSQVTLEDIVKATHEVLEEREPDNGAANQAVIVPSTAVVEPANTDPRPEATSIDVADIDSKTPAAEAVAEIDSQPEPAEKIIPIQPEEPAPDEPESTTDIEKTETTQPTETPTETTETPSSAEESEALPKESPKSLPEPSTDQPDTPATTETPVDVELHEATTDPEIADTATSDSSSGDDNTQDDTSTAEPDTDKTDEGTEDSNDAIEVQSPSDDTPDNDDDNPAPSDNPDAESTPDTEHTTSEEASEQSEIATASTVSEEESVMHDQIDQFLEATDTKSETPEESSEETSSSESPTEDVGPEETPSHNHQLPPEEDEAEYEKDDNTPDMGQLSVHADPNPAPEVAQEMASTTVPSSDQPALASDSPATATNPGVWMQASQENTSNPPTGSSNYPSEPFSLPTMPEATISQPLASPETGQPTPPVAVTGNTSVSGMPISTPPSTTEPVSDYQSQDKEGTHKLVITPLGVSPRPDINQLLAAEEAKIAAGQSGKYMQSDPNPQPQPVASAVQTPEPTPTWQPQPVVEEPPQSAYGPGTDPNSIAL